MTASKLKMIVVGDSQCGKSSLLQQFVHGRFEPGREMTVGVDLAFKTVRLKEKGIKLQIWDTAGQEVFHSITRVYYRGSHVILLVYDVTEERSFEHIRNWLDRIQTAWRGDVTPTIMLVGNKTDLGCHRMVSRERGEAFARRNGMMFCETSAKLGEGVEDAFLLPTYAFVKAHPSLLCEEEALELETPGEEITSGTNCCGWF